MRDERRTPTKKACGDAHTPACCGLNGLTPAVTSHPSPQDARNSTPRKPIRAARLRWARLATAASIEVILWLARAPEISISSMKRAA